MPKKSKLYGWQCSECDRASSSDTMDAKELSAPRRKRTAATKAMIAQAAHNSDLDDIWDNKSPVRAAMVQQQQQQQQKKMPPLPTFNPLPGSGPAVVLPTVPIPMSKMNGNGLVTTVTNSTPPPALSITPVAPAMAAAPAAATKDSAGEERSGVNVQEEEEKRLNLIQQVTAQSALEQKRLKKREKKKKKKKKRERQERERQLAAAAAARREAEGGDEDDEEEEEEEEEEEDDDDDLEIIEDENGCTVRIRPKAIKLKIKTSTVTSASSAAVTGTASTPVAGNGGPVATSTPQTSQPPPTPTPTSTAAQASATPQAAPAKTANLVPTSNGHGLKRSSSHLYDFPDDDETTSLNGTSEKSDAGASAARGSERASAKRRKRSSLNKDLRTHCDNCNSDGSNENLVRCDECKKCYHFWCLNPPVKKSPKVAGYSWHCNECDPSEVDSDWHLD